MRIKRKSNTKKKEKYPLNPEKKKEKYIKRKKK